jgi:trimeric autotransporter adhesin
MSTKTLRKRIALTAVTALGAGLLSVVSTPAANAFGTAGQITIRPNAASGIAAASATETAALSVGLITADTSVALASTATMLASGTLSIGSGSDSTDRIFSVVGGLIVGAGANVTVQTGSTVATTTSSGAKSIAVKPNAGVAQMTVTLTAGTLASPGDLVSRLVVTVVAASAGGVYSAADSSVNTAVVGSSVVDGIDQANVITGSASRIPNGAQGKINFSLKDAYGTALTASVLTATASTGGFVKLSANDVFSATSGGTASVDVGTMRAGSVTVTQAVANAPATVTVTIAYKGVTVGTKTFNFEGEVAKVTVTPTKVAKTTVSSNTDAATIVYNDAAGNVLYPQNAVATTVVTASMGDQTIVNGVTVANYPTAAPVSGKVTISCNATSGTVPALQVRHLNAASGTIVLSNTWAQTCAGAAANLTASWDKASYTPGSIATLTLTFKDAKGFAANSYDLLDTMTITGSPSSTTASAGAAITPLNASAARGGGTTGTVTQQYVVGSTTGDFVAVVVPAASLVTASGNTQANLSVAYKIASSSATVTNEQVLASIVSLIASINKQIVALQKLILQRR